MPRLRKEPNYDAIKQQQWEEFSEHWSHKLLNLVYKFAVNRDLQVVMHDDFPNRYFAFSAPHYFNDVKIPEILPVAYDASIKDSYVMLVDLLDELYREELAARERAKVQQRALSKLSPEEQVALRNLFQKS